MQLVFYSHASFKKRAKLAFTYFFIALRVLRGRYATLRFDDFSTKEDMKKGLGFILLLEDSQRKNKKLALSLQKLDKQKESTKWNWEFLIWPLLSLWWWTWIFIFVGEL